LFSKDFYAYNFIMNIFSLLSYLNKISLVAFFITAGFLVYQVYLLKKGAVPKSEKPTIPDFNENMKVDVANYTQLPVKMAAATIPIKKDNKMVLIILSGLGVLTVALFFILSFRSKPEAPESPVSIQLTSTPKPTFKPRATLPIEPTTSGQLGFLPSASPSASPTVSPVISPTKAITPTSKVTASPSVSPTEVILAVVSPTAALTTTTSVSPSVSVSGTTATPTTITSLPTTGIVDRGLMLFAIAYLLIFFSFVF